ncbi:MFS transporter [Candidatus Pacearchaeota archaeon]|nr:MFS transporter [Candidatus Pacearchaeota archaeon]
MEVNIKKRLRNLYVNQLIRSFGFSLIAIFIPIYLLTLDYSLNSVLGYLLLYYTVLFVFTPISLILSKKMGYKIMMLINIPVAIGYLLLLTLLGKVDIPIYVIAAIGGIEAAFYWMPLSGIFVRSSHKEKRGTQFSKHIALGKISGLLGPLMGGLIAAFLGFNILLYLASLFILLSAIPILKLDNIKPRSKLSLSGIYRLSKSNKNYFIGSISNNIISEVEGIIWPIFVFVILGNLVSVGLIGTLVAVGTVAFTLFIGKISDNKGANHLLKIGGLLYAILWILRIYIDFPLFLYIISIFAGFLFLVIEVPFQRITYNKAAEEKDMDEFILFKELPAFLGRALIFIILILLPSKFFVSFFIAILASLFFVFFRISGKKS